MMVGGGRTPPFAALLGPDWIRTRGRAPSSFVEGISHRFVERGACLHSVASRMRASAARATGQLTKVGRGLFELPRGPQLVLSEDGRINS
eukprot:scaffold107171_cov99-Phaeocystis_antarctica.AAC.4